MTKFLDLRSKMYAIREGGRDQTKKAKRIKRNIIENRVTFDDYLDCLNNSKEKIISKSMKNKQQHICFLLLLLSRYSICSLFNNMLSFCFRNAHILL